MRESATATEANGFLSAWTVYLRPRVLIVLLLGFSSGLPLALSGSTLLSFSWLASAGLT